MTATDLSSVAASLVPYLNAVDAATLRLTSRACRAYVDGALTQLRPFALPNGGFHRLAVPPHFVYREAIKGSFGAAKLHSPFHDSGFQQLALCAPALRSLEVQCMAKGCLDFNCLQGMSQLAALTLLEFPFSDAAAFVGVARCKCLQSLRLQSLEESLVVSNLSSLKQLSALASLSLEPRSFHRAAHSKWRGLSALGCMTALTELRLVYTDEMPGHVSEPPDAAEEGWESSGRAFDASATQALSDCLAQLTGLKALSIRGVHAIPKGIGQLQGLRRLSLEEMFQMRRADVAALSGLSQLTALTLLWDAAAATQHPAPNGPQDHHHDEPGAEDANAADGEHDAAEAGAAQGHGRDGRRGRECSSGTGLLAPLTALQGLRELVFGVEDAGIGRPHGHSLHPKDHHTIAYLCGEQLEHVSSLQGLTHLSIEPRGWQSCCMTAHYPTADAAVADLRTPLADAAPWLAPMGCGKAARREQGRQLHHAAAHGPAGPQAVPGGLARASSLPALGTHGAHSSKGRQAARAGCGAGAPGASLFLNHPEFGSFLVAWPLCALLRMAPCMGKLPVEERAVVRQLLRRAVVGQGLVEGGSMGTMFAHLQLAQQRSSLPAASVLPRLAAAGSCLRRIDLTMDKHWSQKAMGQLGELQALPGLQALRLDCGRLEAPEALWSGVAALTRLRWLSLRWFDCVPMGHALAPLVQLEALQLRDTGHLPELGEFVTALSGMRRLRYLGLEGCLLDGADDLLGGLWGLLAGDRYSLAWIELTLTRQPMLQLLASLMGSFFLGSLLHAPRWPEMMLTFLLAVIFGGVLAATTALVLVPMLLGWGPGARLYEQLAPIRQLRYLSLRRSNFSSPSSLSLATPRRRPNSLLGLARCLPDLRFLDAMWLNAEPSELLALARLPGLHYLALQRSQLGARWQWQLGGGGAVVVEATGGLEGLIEREVLGQG